MKVALSATKASHKGDHDPPTPKEEAKETGTIEETPLGATTNEEEMLLKEAEKGKEDRLQAENPTLKCAAST